MRFFSVLRLICLIVFGCNNITGEIQSSHAASPENQTTKLAGKWRLVEFADLDSASNSWIYPLGLHPKGISIYTGDSVFNVTLSAEHPLQIPEDSADKVTIKLVDYIQHYGVGFFGTYSVDKNRSTLIHHVEGGTNPFYIGTDQPRPFTLNGDTLLIGDNRSWKRVLVRMK